MIKIILVDDHTLVRTSIKNILDEVEDFHVIGEAENGEEIIETLKDLTPDVVVMDIAMPIMDGLEATKIICKKYPDIKILILSTHQDKEYINLSFKNGAMGYMFKNADEEEFIDAIRTVSRNERYSNDSVSKAM